jgi:uncharacterized protein (DUF2147 family)
MMRVRIATFFLLLLAQAQNDGVLGNWTNPTGSSIQIYRCGPSACARVIAIRKNAPGRVDFNNPNPALRKRSLCSLQIGTNFHLTDPNHAEDGQLYDPESGKTYRGSMTREGDKLMLRGYIGIRLFGRTEIWTRAPSNIAICRP